jgi:hypothetical protein
MTAIAQTQTTPLPVPRINLQTYNAWVASQVSLPH